jgi:quercetin dioxygenase-like cupin family protein
MSEKFPFKEITKGNIKKRTFDEYVDDHELKWHFDAQDRNVKILESDGWQIQMDDQLPKTLNEGDTLFIPKGVYHRVIKGNGKLVILIKENGNR